MTDFMKTPCYVIGWQGPVPQPSDATFTLFAVRNGAEDTLATYAAGAKAVRLSRDINDYVQEKRAGIIQTRLADLANAAYHKLAPYDGAIATAAATLASLENNLAERKMPMDPASVQRAGWIVNWFMGLQPDARVIALAQAQDNADVETLSALLAAPKVLNLIGESYRSAIEARMLATGNPAKYDEMINMRVAVQVAQEAVDRVKSWIRSDIGMTSDPRAELKSDAPAPRFE